MHFLQQFQRSARYSVHSVRISTLVVRIPLYMYLPVHNYGISVQLWLSILTRKRKLNELLCLLNLIIRLERSDAKELATYYNRDLLSNRLTTHGIHLQNYR